MSLAQEALELGEQWVTPREVWRRDAIPWPERVRELLSWNFRLGLAHVISRIDVVFGRGTPVGAASAGLCT